MSQLLDLPTEVLEKICSWVATDPDSLWLFSRTCCRSYEVSEPFLLRSMKIRSGLDVCRIWSLLNYRQERASHIHHLNVVPERNDIYNHLRQISELTKILTNIRHLELGDPMWFDLDFLFTCRDWDEWRQSTLQGMFAPPNHVGHPMWYDKLKEFKLNIKPYGPYQYEMPSWVHSWAAVLHASNIRKVMITNMDLRGFKAANFSLEKHSSSLQELHFDYCSFDRNSACQLLMIPHSLKIFSYTPCFAYHVPNAADVKKTRGLMFALAEQGMTLHTLRWMFDYTFSDNGRLLDVRQSLKKLRSLQHAEICLDDKDLKKGTIIYLLSELPTSVHSLRFLDSVSLESPRAVLNAMRKIPGIKSLPNLRQIDFCVISKWNVIYGSIQRQFERAGKQLQEIHDIHVRIFAWYHILQRSPNPFDAFKEKACLVYDNSLLIRLWDTAMKDDLGLARSGNMEDALEPEYNGKGAGGPGTFTLTLQIRPSSDNNL